VSITRACRLSVKTFPAPPRSHQVAKLATELGGLEDTRHLLLLISLKAWLRVQACSYFPIKLKQAPQLRREADGRVGSA
jgi:hypothetical protein